MAVPRVPEFTVRLSRISAEEGGRRSGPPAAASDLEAEYRTIGTVGLDDPRASGFSLIVWRTAGVDQLDWYEATRLVAAAAPAVQEGQNLVLWEGARAVARGTVLRSLLEETP
jgi:hypothetical protein